MGLQPGRPGQPAAGRLRAAARAARRSSTRHSSGTASRRWRRASRSRPCDDRAEAVRHERRCCGSGATIWPSSSAAATIHSMSKDRAREHVFAFARNLRPTQGRSSSCRAWSPRCSRTRTFRRSASGSGATRGSAAARRTDRLSRRPGTALRACLQRGPGRLAVGRSLATAACRPEDTARRRRVPAFPRRIPRRPLVACSGSSSSSRSSSGSCS